MTPPDNKLNGVVILRNLVDTIGTLYSTKPNPQPQVIIHEVSTDSTRGYVSTAIFSVRVYTTKSQRQE